MDAQSRPAISVEKIIALKRHEQPPPGYFRLLPDRIINRIEHGEGPSSFWEKWGPAFRVRAVLAYALGLTVCTALTVGVWFSPKLDQGAGGSDSGRGAGGLWNRSARPAWRLPWGGALAGQHQSGHGAAPGRLTFLDAGRARHSGVALPGELAGARAGTG